MMSTYFIDGEQIKIGNTIELDSQLYANAIIDKNKDESLCSITIAFLFILVYNKYIK